MTVYLPNILVMLLIKATLVNLWLRGRFFEVSKDWYLT